MQDDDKTGARALPGDAANSASCLPPSATLPKPALRAAMLARLRAMPAGERRERSDRLIARLTGMALWQRARSVALFAPLRSEVDLDRLWVSSGAWAEKRCAYPRMEGHDLVLHRVIGPSELYPRTGVARLREPAADAPKLEGWPDLILVPGLAFTAAGGRLGRGGGFYDRLLARAIPAGCPALGLGFSFQVVERLPLERHDILLSHVLTDEWAAGESGLGPGK